MRSLSLALLLFVCAMMLFAPCVSVAAEDGATLYKSKCAGCHGADAAGKPPKIPALKGKSLSEEQISDVLQKGAADKKAPHNAAFKNINEEQAKAIAAYVKSLK